MSTKQSLEERNGVINLDDDASMDKYLAGAHEAAVKKVRKEVNIEDFFIDPFHDYVVVQPFIAEEKTAGGILIPHSYTERMNKATVIALGDSLAEKKVKVGMNVLHIKGAGTMIEQDGEEFYIMRYTDLLCRIKD